MKIKEGQLVRKIYVKALDDLPKDNKKYDVLWKGNDFHRMHGRTMQRYIKHIDWYLQPVEEQESKLNCNICGKNKIDIYPICAKCWDDAHSKQTIEEQESKPENEHDLIFKKDAIIKKQDNFLNYLLKYCGTSQRIRQYKLEIKNLKTDEDIILSPI